MPEKLSTGPKLPYDIRGGRMASSPDGNGVLLFGGYRHSRNIQGYLDSILELRSNGQGWASSWTTLTAKLQYRRGYHVVIPIVMDIDTCELNV